MEHSQDLFMILATLADGMLSLVLVACILIFLFKILNVNNYPEKSLLYCANAQFLDAFLKRVPELSEPYIPTRFWGFSGHIQTIIQGVISRLHCPLVNGYRVFLKLTDGATVSYDLYQSLEEHPEGGDFTLAICPGIGNNSESVYIRRTVYNAQKHGYRVAVLNHIGTLPTVPVTSPRIFNYGATCDYSAMIKDIVRRIKPSNVIAGISVCQGYDANRAMHLLLEWKGFRRLYIYAMTENMKAIIRRWTPALFSDDIKRKLGVTERQVFNSGTLQELDDIYTRKLAGFNTVHDFYKAMSCCHHLKNIKIPMVFMNSLDDPIVPPPLLEVIRDATLNNDNLIYVEQKFGGHLGFYEGGFMYSNPLTWQDRMIVKIGHALVAGHASKTTKPDFEEEVNFKASLYLNQSSLSSESEKDEEFEAKSEGRLECGGRVGGLVTAQAKSENHSAQRIPYFETPVTSEENSSAVDSDSWITSDEESDSFPPSLTPPNTPLPKTRMRSVGLNLFPE